MTAQLRFGPEPPYQYDMVWEVRLKPVQERTPYYVTEYSKRAPAEAVVEAVVESLPLTCNEPPEQLRQRLSDHLNTMTNGECFRELLATSFGPKNLQRDILNLIFQSDLARVSIAPNTVGEIWRALLTRNRDQGRVLQLAKKYLIAVYVWTHIIQVTALSRNPQHVSAREPPRPARRITSRILSRQLKYHLRYIMKSLEQEILRFLEQHSAELQSISAIAVLLLLLAVAFEMLQKNSKLEAGTRTAATSAAHIRASEEITIINDSFNVIIERVLSTGSSLCDDLFSTYPKFVIDLRKIRKSWSSYRRRVEARESADDLLSDEGSLFDDPIHYVTRQRSLLLEELLVKMG